MRDRRVLYGGLGLLGLVFLASGGPRGLATAVGLLMLGIGAVALVRGQVRWAAVGNRRVAGIVTAGALVVLCTVGALSAPAEEKPARDSEVLAPVAGSARASATGSASPTAAGSSEATVAPTSPAATSVAPTTPPPPAPAPPPPAPPPPADEPEPEPAGNCHPSYEGACLPIVDDLDCADVPGTVRVVGPDVYRLDRDKDGWGCE